jgi:DNA modification methylase
MDDASISSGYVEESIQEFTGDIDPQIDIAHQSQILIVSKDQSYLTHGIHKFPAKFFPELPRYLIRKYSAENDTVLDPMCGSGTVILEALLNQRNSIGIDIDPIAQLVTKVKTTPIKEETLSDSSKQLLTLISERIKDYSPNIPEFNYRDSWFRSFVLHELGILCDSINEYSMGVSQDIYDFHRVVFSSIIRDVSNADPHCTRTVIRKKQIKDISPGDVLDQFVRVLLAQVQSMIQLERHFKSYSLLSCHLPKTNAMETELDDDSISLVVTSPPYINAVDYPRTHQLEMYWLGFVEEGPLSNMKRRYIGTETVYKSEYESLKQMGHEPLDSNLKHIYEIDPRRSYITYKFFEDMQKQLNETYRILEPGGYYCIAIGNNLIRGIRIRSHEILTGIATSEEVGFRLEKMFFSGLIRHFIKIPRRERMNGEWVIILKKPE